MLKGEDRAFAAFFDDHFSRLFRFVLPRVAGDEDLAEDVVQAVLCKAIDKLANFRGESTLFTWLCTFCRFEVSARFRRSGGKAVVEFVEDQPSIRAALESLPASLTDDPAGQLDRTELKRLVQVVLDALPVRYATALELKYLDDCSVKQIAERLDLSPKAAESVLTRAREAFRDAYGRGSEWTLRGGHVMSPDSNRPTDPTDPKQDPVGDLIRMGGRRPATDAERVRRSRAKVEAHWKKAVQARSKRRTYGWVAFAAAAGLAGMLWLLQGTWSPDADPRAIAANVSRVDGVAEAYRADTEQAVELSAEDDIAIGTRIVTPPNARVALALQETGHSVRIDQGATLEIVGPETLVLERGRIYVDSGMARDRAIPIRVQTPYGVVQDIGTQFELSVVEPAASSNGAGAIRVRVREGAVVVRTANGTERLDVGQAGRFTADGESSITTLRTYGEEWDWVHSFTLAFPIEGFSAQSFLEWAAREGGWQLIVHPDASSTARDAILNGDIEGLSIEEALAGVLPTCGLQHRIDDGELVVTLAGG